MKIQYICHHEDKSEIKYEKVFNTLEEAQLSNSLNWWYIEKRILEWDNNS